MRETHDTRQARIQELIVAIATTEDAEIDCDGASQVLARYVDRVVAGELADPMDGGAPDIASGLPLHLRHCPHCAEMYAMLLELARREAAGELEVVDELWSDLRRAIGMTHLAPADPLTSAQAAR